jgi:hypothetical protein
MRLPLPFPSRWRAPAARRFGLPLQAPLRASLFGLAVALVWGLAETIALWRTRRLRRLDRLT